MKLTRFVPGTVVYGILFFLILAGCSNPFIGEIFRAVDEITFTVTFESNEGSTVESQIITKGSRAERPSNPTKEGSGFVNWYSNAGFAGPRYDFDTPVYSDITLYAKWDTPYTLTYNTNGGSAVESEIVGAGGTTLKPADPTKAGYEFDGWYAEGAILEWDFENDPITANITLYAKWLQLFTVTFNSNEGSEVDDQEIADGRKAIEPEDPERDGYTFGGWYKEATFTNEWDFENDTVTATLTLYARWYSTVSFNSNSGSSVTSQNVTVGDKVNEPTDPTRGTYTFGGWYKEATFASEWDFDNDVPTGHTTLHAKWTYTITFDVNNGTGTTPVSQTANAGQSIPLPSGAGLSRTGFNFDGWNTNSDGTGTSYSTVYTDNNSTGDITLYAKWRDITYGVTFNSNGGSDVDSQPVIEGQKATKPVDPTRTGYEFDGWYKESNFATLWNFATDTVTGPVTLYAKWHSNVSFNLNGGTGTAPTMQQVTAGSSIPLPTPNPPSQKAGLTFAGWNTSSALPGAQASSPYTPSGHITLYARWTGTVTFNSNSGNVVSPQTVAEGGVANQPSNPTRSGYTFDGWYSNEGLTTLYSFSTPITGHITLYAKWTYTVSFSVNSGNGTAPSPLTANAGDNITLPASTGLSRTGYTFAGWNTSSASTGGTNRSAGASYNDTTDSPAGTKILYARWTPITYTVAYNSAGGTGSMTSTSMTYDTPGSLAANGFTAPSGLQFLGWTKSGSSTIYQNGASVNNLTTTNGATVTFYAVWGVP